MAETTTRQILREQCANELGLRFTGLGDTLGSDISIEIIVPEIGDRFSEAMAPLASFISKDTDPETFRRIIGYDDATGRVDVNRTLGLLEDDPVSIYNILTPVEWNQQIGIGLRDLYFTDRFSVTPVSGQSLYSLSGAPWIQSGQQVLELIFQTASGTPVWTREVDVPAWDTVIDANAISILIPSMPAAISDLTIIVVARHFYEELATDAATTTCPRQLAKAAVKVAALRRIWDLVGEQEAMILFGAEMRDAEGQLVKQKKLHVPQVEQHPIHFDRNVLGAELAVPAGSHRW